MNCIPFGGPFSHGTRCTHWGQHCIYFLFFFLLVFFQFSTLLDHMIQSVCITRFVMNVCVVVETLRFFYGPLPGWLCHLWLSVALTLSFHMYTVHAIAQGKKKIISDITYAILNKMAWLLLRKRKMQYIKSESKTTCTKNSYNNPEECFRDYPQ